jgi:Cleaved Adhesin Domain
MPRLTYTTPFLASMLALAACPGDDVPADTEGTSTGDSTGDLTSVGPTTLPPTTTTVEPDSTTDPDSTGEPMCMQPCAANECCLGGFCFDAPEPACEERCGEFEACLCPEGSDPCDCTGECVQCGIDGPTETCLDAECPAGSFCVLDDPAAPTFGWCALQGCGEDSCACPLPADGNAVPTCGEFAGDDGSGSCFLDCSAGGATCPEGMVCRTAETQSVCVWPGDDIVSSCCTSNPGTTGCDDPTCETAVCDADPYCCETEWDQLCADAVPALCVGLCPGAPDPEPQYGDCINGGPCDVGLVCLSDMASTFGWCGTLDCVDDTVCQPPPATGDAPAICGALDMDTDVCLLDCSMDQTCPDGMVCFSGFACVWEEIVPPPPVLPGYGDCADNPVATCQPGEDTCLTDAGGMAAGCSQSGCMAVGDCLAMVPATGDAPATCGDLGGGNTCYLDCAGGQTCPDGTACTAVGMGMACLWPDNGFVLDEDFEIGALRPGWSVLDVDGNVPDAMVSFVSDAFVVLDQFEPAMNFGAYSTSWYAPPDQSDDWLITPQLTLGPASVLSWDAWSPDPMYPDGYEVRISIAGPTVMEFTANAALFTIADEADVFTSHMVDLAAAGYLNQDVYIAFRNNSNDEFILVVDNVQVTE